MELILRNRTALSAALLILSLAAMFSAPRALRAAGETPAKTPATKPAALPFEKEIEAFEAADAKHAPPSGAVLFVGSSSIRKWTTVAADFPGLAVINRGFGGSKIPDSTHYASRIVTPYKPRAIVFYAGDNDLAGGRTPEGVLADYKAFVAEVRRSLAETPILFLAIKPSLARVKLIATQNEANRLVREYVAADKTLSYVDVATPMFKADGQPRPELFVSDGLHMNAEGYKIWTSILTPLLKEFAPPKTP